MRYYTLIHAARLIKRRLGRGNCIPMRIRPCGLLGSSPMGPLGSTQLAVRLQIVKVAPASRRWGARGILDERPGRVI